jgi:flavin-dependent dehydrogenase
MYDAIVVGARCAGAPTALLLARSGCKVLLVDRATFPSDIPHGHLIHRNGPVRLAAWGLLDRITATSCPAISSITTNFGDFSLTGVDLVRDGVAVAYGPRRSALDAVLVDAAIEAGVEVRTGFPVQEYIGVDGRVEGIRARGRNGEPVIEKATITIGADGRNSHLARAVGAPSYEALPSLTCWYFSYWSGVPGNALEIHGGADHVIFAFPTNDGLFAVFIAWRAAELSRLRGDIETAFLQTLGAAPALAERVRAGRREERFYGATDVPNFLRKPYGPGWALVGDAGVHKDPYGALGVCDAFRDAELLCDALQRLCLPAILRRRACRVRAATERTDAGRLPRQRRAREFPPSISKPCSCGARCGTIPRRPATSTSRSSGGCLRSLFQSGEYRANVGLPLAGTTTPAS